MNEKIIREIEEKLGYHFQNKKLLVQAFTHRSFVNTQADAVHNERLEFLGDSVLGFVVAEDLYRRFPEEAEGSLSKMKAYMVHSDVLATITENSELHRFLLVEKSGRKEKEIRNNRKLKENLLEAIIGAIYLDGGISAATRIILNLFNVNGFRVSDPKQAVFDYKTRLQEAFQHLGLTPPDYILLERRGPVHNAVFKVELRFNGIPLATGEGQSKKQAHQDCAARILKQTENGKTLGAFLHEADPDFPA